jgi:Ca-activated chloride channel homolog
MKTKVAWGVAWLLFLATSAWGQGILIVVDPPHPVPLPRPIIWPRPPMPPPEPPMSYKIKELSVQARIVDQVARVQVSQSFVNTGSRQMEVAFVFPLPYDGAVDQLTFMVDGKEYPGKLLPAKEARSIYESYVRRNQDPALLEWIGTGMFKTSVFPVPPGAERKVTMRYNQLLRKDRQVTDFLFPLSTAKYTSSPVEKVSIEASIESEIEIKSVYSPTHAVDVRRPDDRHAVAKYEVTNQVPSGDFRLFFDNTPGKVGASVLSYRPEKEQEGYFLLLASPQIETKSADRPKKTAILVVDRSGSMSGKKMDQAKEALKFVLSNLREGDTFNIIAYDSNVESFRPELQRFDEATRKAALGFVEGLYAGGSTNIDGALSAALNMIQDASRPSYIVFLTDGLPTAGETNEAKIVDRSRQANKHRSRLITLGVGYDVNSRLLDRLSAANHGQSEFSRPDENLEAHVGRLYSRISSPVLTEVTVNFDLEGVRPEDGAAVNRVYPRDVRDLFEGEQLVLVGRYKKPGDAKVVVRGKLGKDEQKFDFPAKLVEKSPDESYAFVEKLWAVRRIGEIIDELDLQGKNDELIQELVTLSTKHGILTPYTSFLADDNPPPRLAGGPTLSERGGGFDFHRTTAAVERLREEAGKSAFAQRAEKRRLQNADQAPLDSGFAVPAAEAAPGMMGGVAPGGAGLGYGGHGAKAARPPATSGVHFRDIDSDKEVGAQNVQIVAGQTLYRRGQQWFAANAKDVDVKKDADKIKTVTRFSENYFKLVAANTASENAVLSRQQAGEELVIKLRGQIYLIR